MSRRDLNTGEVILTQPHRGGALVPLGVPGALKTYHMSDVADLEEDLRLIQPFIASFERNARSRQNRPTRHRLVGLVEAAEEDVRAHRAGRPGRHLMDVVELGQVVQLLLHWRVDPAGAEIVADLKDPGVYAHSVLLLAAARSLRVWRNDVRLVRKQPTRAPDVTIATDDGDIAVELKAPREFDGRDWERQKGPAQLAADVLKRSSAQRRTRTASLLVVAGYRIPEVIRDIFADEISTRLPLRPELAAVLLQSLGADSSDQAQAATAVAAHAPITRTLTPEETRAVLSLPIAMRILRNAHYRGPIQVVGLEDVRSGLRLPAHSMFVRARPPVLVEG